MICYYTLHHSTLIPLGGVYSRFTCLSIAPRRDIVHQVVENHLNAGCYQSKTTLGSRQATVVVPDMAEMLNCTIITLVFRGADGSRETRRVILSLARVRLEV